jgi:hypothetical protein
MRAGNPFILLPWRAGGCVRAWKTQLDPWSVSKASPRNHRKKRMRCPMPVKLTRPNRKLRACLRLRGAGTSRSFFAVIPGWSVEQSRTKTYPRLGPSGASHVPRIWIRSIGLGEVCVKRKSQNLVKNFPRRLYLVVDFPDERSPGMVQSEGSGTEVL